MNLISEHPFKAEMFMVCNVACYTEYQLHPESLCNVRVVNADGRVLYPVIASAVRSYSILSIHI